MKRILLAALAAAFCCPLVAPAQITSRSYASYVGSYSSTTTYAKGDVVTYNGVTYVSTSSSNLNNTPGSASQWTQLSQPQVTASIINALSGLTVSTTGNAGTATALAAAPTTCSAGYAPTGIAANGNATGCFQPSSSAFNGGTVTNGITAPSFTSNATGAGGGYAATEGPAATAAVGVDNAWADSTAHRWMFNLNGVATNYFYVGIASAATGGNCAKFAANGIDIVDAGAACGTSASSGFPITLGSTPIAASSTTTSLAGVTLDGISPTQFGYYDINSSLTSLLNGKQSTPTEVVITYSATPAFLATASSNTITLTGNVTSSTLAAGTSGQSLTVTVCQDATGSRTFVWPTNMRGTITIGSTASKCSVQNFTYSSSVGAWLATSTGVINQ